ncbi:HNH endonuclease [Tenacibaculum finnmarkense]|uniref:HNH endonuclease n=1 Tax=Tenacibaculum finnmarkense TaxID=2781243 RepID=UPI0018E9109F|nr:HNH endonuclease [Tenacibaculum finnmarkense]MCD8413474.1 HNH endonuclease [Tenacibaculum finnmarkense genomovar ulcerans]WCC41594.1 HNH endonuclease [Tenacibaculum finnmarkense]
MIQKITRNFYNERWVKIQFDDAISKNENFIISNYGRVINCKNKNHFLTKESFTNGYRSLALKKTTGSQTGRYVHKLVAQEFLENTNNGVFVIHLNYDKSNNHVENLKWATKREKEIHQHKNPEYQKIMRERVHPFNSKLTATKVMRLKKRINNPKRGSSLKKIAKEFGISGTQLHRIKKGINWANVQ